MDQRVGVDELDRAGHRHDVGLAAASAGGGDRQQRPDPLAAGEDRVAHRGVQIGRRGVGSRKSGFQRLVDPRALDPHEGTQALVVHRDRALSHRPHRPHRPRAVGSPARRRGRA